MGFSLKAQQTLSLSDAIAKALENNYDIRMIKKTEQTAEVMNSWGAAGRYPYVYLSAYDYNYFYMPEGDDYSSNVVNAKAYVSWTLFDGFAVKINKQRYEELEKLSKQNTAIMVEGTIQSVVLTYYDVLLQKELLSTYDEVMTLSEDRYKQSKIKKELGAIVTYDLLQAQNSYLSDRSNYLLQEVQYKNALRDLNYILAEENDAKFELTSDFKAVPVEYSVADLQTQMSSNNKSLQNQYINQRLLENAILSAKSAYAPSLSFTGGLSGTTTREAYVDGDESWTKTSNVYGHFTLSFNLFSGGSRNRAMQIAKVEEEIGLIEVDAMQHDLNNSLANLFELYLVRKELLFVADENMEAAKLNLQISQEKFDTGAINSFNFRDVQNIYLDASQNKFQAIYNFIDTHTALLRMAGTIVQDYE